MKDAESCALYNTLNKGYIAICLKFYKIVSSPAKRVWGETSTQGSNPCLSAKIKIKSGVLYYLGLYFFEETDRFAADTLFPPEDYKLFVQNNTGA